MKKFIVRKLTTFFIVVLVLFSVLVGSAFAAMADQADVDIDLFWSNCNLEVGFHGKVDPKLNAWVNDVQVVEDRHETDDEWRFRVPVPNAATMGDRLTVTLHAEFPDGSERTWTEEFDNPVSDCSNSTPGTTDFVANATCQGGQFEVVYTGGTQQVTVNWNLIVTENGVSTPISGASAIITEETVLDFYSWVGPVSVSVSGTIQIYDLEGHPVGDPNEGEWSFDAQSNCAEETEEPPTITPIPSVTPVPPTEQPPTWQPQPVVCVLYTLYPEGSVLDFGWIDGAGGWNFVTTFPVQGEGRIDIIFDASPTPGLYYIGTDVFELVLTADGYSCVQPDASIVVDSTTPTCNGGECPPAYCEITGFGATGLAIIPYYSPSKGQDVEMHVYWGFDPVGNRIEYRNADGTNVVAEEVPGYTIFDGVTTDTTIWRDGVQIEVTDIVEVGVTEYDEQCTLCTGAYAVYRVSDSGNYRIRYGEGSTPSETALLISAMFELSYETAYEVALEVADIWDDYLGDETHLWILVNIPESTREERQAYLTLRRNHPEFFGNRDYNG